MDPHGHSHDEFKDQDECCVCVAVKVRPLVASEVALGCDECLAITPGRPQLRIGSQPFTYDHVYYENGGEDPRLLFKDCVLPLVDGLFKGYNATVFAYGQTGSGKTHTMGSSYNSDGSRAGVIPDVLSSIFSRVAATRNAEFTIRVSFVEIHKVRF